MIPGIRERNALTEVDPIVGRRMSGTDVYNGRYMILSRLNVSLVQLGAPNLMFSSSAAMCATPARRS